MTRLIDLALAKVAVRELRTYERSKCQEKCNFRYEAHEQVWSQIRNWYNEEGEILDDLVRKDGIARITT